MFDAIVRFSVRKKLFVGLTTLFLLIGGIYAMMTLPIDAVPDITNNQVQIVTGSPTLAPQEVEQLITFPIEIAMSNIMNVEEIRSVSRFGLSLVTVVFKESVPTLQARQLIGEQIQAVAGEIPPELGTPELMPVTTGLGEIYQYTLEVAPGYEDKYDAMELRTIQDWIVKRQLSGIPGIVEINSFGGYLKQYEVAVDPDALYSLNITIGEVFEALNRNNQNTGGSYIEKVNRAYYIRSEGMIDSLEDIERIVVTNRNGIPVHVSDVAKVRYGSAKRFGAMTIDGKGECVGGIAMMLKGANANVVTTELEKRVAQVQKMLPEGIRIEPYLNRSELVDRNISTVIRNLIEGAIIVFLVLIIFLGNVRAGLIVASVIPLAMLFAFILMRVFGVSANLMSLGAIDFGIVVDGSIVILEGILAHIYSRQFRGRTLTKEELVVQYNRAKIARYGINIEELNTIVRTAYAGEAAGVVFENERRFDLVLRLDYEMMINHFNEVRKSREYPMCTSRIIRISCPHLLRPVFLTGLVASLGFVPMAIATSAGAEVQRPLATVVIGGLIVSTVLTLLIIPVFYHIVNSTVMLRTGKLKKWFGLGLLACLAAGIPSGVHAQEAPQSISLNQALEMAVQHSPRLQMADTDLARIRATRGEVFEATPTEFSYSWGQLNGVQRKDKELAVTQSVGSLLTPFYKNALVNKQVQTGNLYKQLVEKEVKAEVKRAWAYYLYAWNLKDMYKQQSTLADKMQKAGEVRYKQGDISLLEKSMITTVASDMRHKLYQADEELKLAASRLQWICYADFPIAPDDNSIQLYPVSIDTVSLSEIHLDYLQSQVHEKRALLNIERSRFFPELSVGYVRQNILPDKGLNSWMIGVSFPIWFLPQRSKIRQARFEMNKAQTQAEAQTRELNLKVSELRASIRRYAESIRFYTTSALTEADNLMKTADAQFRESESDITQYVQSLNAALEIKKGYIEAVYQYNLAALEYELYHQ
ncbi:efflux RND transporter permease subunit [Phocaeicola barnesiae]